MTKFYRGIFYKFGLSIYRHRKLIISLWVLGLCFCVVYAPSWVSNFKTTGFVDENSQSAKANDFINEALGYKRDNSLIVLYNHKNVKVTDSNFIKTIDNSLKPLKSLKVKYITVAPYGNFQVSKDKHWAYATIIFKKQGILDDELLSAIKTKIKVPDGYRVWVGGESIFTSDVNHQTQQDLFKADFIAAPLALVVLLLLFRTVVAAILPLLAGASTAILTLMSLYIASQHWLLSIFTINIALMLGLCLSLDYALFIISRYRDELKLTDNIDTAIAKTEATAGKSVFYSGIAVLISISALLLFSVNILFSLAVGGMIAVFFAVMSATILLPAILSTIGKNINKFAVYKENRSRKRSIWQKIAESVTDKPRFFSITILVLLILLGYPIKNIELGISNYKILPEGSPYRAVFDEFAAHFNIEELNPIEIIVKSKTDILSKSNMHKINDLSKEIQKYSGIAKVRMVVVDYKPKFVILNAITYLDINSDAFDKMYAKLRKVAIPKGLSLEWTGIPVMQQDVYNAISKQFRLAFFWIICTAYIILFLLLRSIVLPLKAIMTTLLSLSVCYGVLVLIFQDGYGHHLLNFQTQGMLDVSLIVIIFCALFGFSMDYEVFLLSRIHEYYIETKNLRYSIVHGIDKSSKVITSAAFMVMVICSAFISGDVLMVKAFGIGIAVAVFVDAFLIRTILVPAIMMCIGEWNWYLPKFLQRFQSS